MNVYELVERCKEGRRSDGVLPKQLMAVTYVGVERHIDQRVRENMVIAYLYRACP
jgi:hypothetical protein